LPEVAQNSWGNTSVDKGLGDSEDIVQECASVAILYFNLAKIVNLLNRTLLENCEVTSSDADLKQQTGYAHNRPFKV
jgi:hypothetical protein